MNGAFTDIARPPEPTNSGKVAGAPSLANIASLLIGAGNTGFRATPQGIWMGAKAFADAAFSVDNQGRLVLKLPGGGTAGIIIDASNKTIIVNDGTVDRILIGYLAGKF